MKRYLQRDTSGLSARYEVYGECGELLYRIRGKNTPSGESMRIDDRDDGTLCKVRRLGFQTLSAYSISLPGETVRLNIAVTGLVAVRFRGISFSVRGDVLSGSYDIIDADRTVVCAVYRDFAKECTHLTIYNTEREILCIAAAACINSLTADAAPALQMT